MSEYSTSAEGQFDMRSCVDFEALLSDGQFVKVFLIKVKRGKFTNKKMVLKCMERDLFLSNYGFPKPGYAQWTSQEFVTMANPSSFLSPVEAFQTRSHLCLLADFLHCQNVRTYIDQHGVFQERQVKLITAQLIAALRFLHERELSYGCLNPSNILLEANGRVLLVDNLYKKYLEKGLEYRASEGLEFLAPEVLLGGGAQPSADWWALGCCAVTLVTGESPYELFSVAEEMLIQNVCGEEEVCLFGCDNLSREAISFLNGLLTKPQESRLGSKSSLQLVKHAWFLDVSWDNLSTELQFEIQLPAEAPGWQVPEIDSRDVLPHEAIGFFRKSALLAFHDSLEDAEYITESFAEYNDLLSESQSNAVMRSVFDFEKILDEDNHSNTFVVKVKRGQFASKKMALKCFSRTHLYGRQRPIKENYHLWVKEPRKTIDHIIVSSNVAAFQTNSHLCLLIPYEMHERLDVYIQRNTDCSLILAKNIITQLFLALNFFHQNGIIYRDLNLSRITINRYGRVKIDDCVYRKYLEHQYDLNADDAFEYLAPECFTGGEICNAADWWSVGCIFHKLLLSKSPLQAFVENKEAFIRELTNKNEIYIEEAAILGRNVHLLIKRLLKKTPSLRIGYRNFDAIKRQAFLLKTKWDVFLSEDFKYEVSIISTGTELPAQAMPNLNCNSTVPAYRRLGFFDQTFATVFPQSETMESEQGALEYEEVMVQSNDSTKEELCTFLDFRSLLSQNDEADTFLIRFKQGVHRGKFAAFKCMPRRLFRPDLLRQMAPSMKSNKARGINFLYVCGPLTAFQTQTHLCLLSEYPETESLTSYLKRNKFVPEHMLAKITIQLLYGISFFHQNDILLKDFNPDMVLLQANGLTKIKHSSHMFRLRECMETVRYNEEYLAPEYFLGRELTQASDYWSLGCIVMMMLRGQTPYKQQFEVNRERFLEKMKNNSPVPFPILQYPHEWKTFLQLTVRKDIERRNIDLGDLQNMSKFKLMRCFKNQNWDEFERGNIDFPIDIVPETGSQIQEIPEIAFNLPINEADLIPGFPEVSEYLL